MQNYIDIFDITKLYVIFVLNFDFIHNGFRYVDRRDLSFQSVWSHYCGGSSRVILRVKSFYFGFVCVIWKFAVLFDIYTIENNANEFVIT